MPATGGISQISVDNISPNPRQPRIKMDEEELSELAASIREKGIIQPLILRKNPRDPQGYEIVAGERRWRAAQRQKGNEQDSKPVICHHCIPARASGPKAIFTDLHAAG